MSGDGLETAEQEFQWWKPRRGMLAEKRLTLLVPIIKATWLAQRAQNPAQYLKPNFN